MSNISSIALATIQVNSVATFYVSSVCTPNASDVVVIDVFHHRDSGAAAQTPTTTGLGLTWVQEAAVNLNNTSFVLRRLRSQGNAVPSVVTLAWADNQSYCGANIYSLAGADTTGTNGSGAFSLQSTTSFPFAGNSAPSMTLNAVASNSATIGAFASLGGNNFTAGTGYASRGQATFGSKRVFSECSDIGSVTVNASCTTQSVAGLASEVKVAATGTNYGLFGTALIGESALVGSTLIA